MTHTVFHVPPPRVIGETQGQYKARVDLESLAANYRQRLDGGDPEGGG